MTERFAAPIVRLHAEDDVVIAKQQWIGGMPINSEVTVRGLIPAGHKMAIRPIQQGDQYGGTARLSILLLDASILANPSTRRIYDS